MESARDASVLAPRPYRSHKVRACDYCRKRKQRCLVEAIGQPCHLCRLQRIQCLYTAGDDIISATRSMSRSAMRGSGFSGQPSRKRSDSTSRNEKRLPTSMSGTGNPNAVSTDETRDDENNYLDPLQQSAHIVGPFISRDAHVLEQYMSPGSPEGPRTTANPYNVYSADPHMPVLYTKVLRRRQGLSMSQEPGIKQKEIMDQILGPDTDHVINLYLEHIYPCFPIIDERMITSTNSANKGSSSTLLCELYASALSYWDQAEITHRKPRPDQRFAWNLAVAALQEDFQAPGISTLQAVLVDLTGRPVFSLTGNVINNGRSVALAYSLGLNRNPMLWNLSRQEKLLRVRLWWGVLIHDTWGSFAHGTPPIISPNHHDVPIPTYDDLSPLYDMQNERQNPECFLALCRLTEILQHLLPLAYDLRGKSQRDIRKILRSVEIELDEWEENLPSCLERSSTKDVLVSGSTNLHLSFLSLKMLACRISLHAMSHCDAEDADAETLFYHQAKCRKSAIAIVNFIGSLKSSHLAEFWLPYSAYYLTSAATLLLRFAVETTDDDVAASCVSKVKNFMRNLREMRESYGWDIADHCLTQCEGIIARMIHNGRPQNENIEGRVSAEGLPPLSPMPLPDFNGPLDWLDSSLPTSFGLVGMTGQGRDIWNMFDMNDLSNQSFLVDVDYNNLQ